MQVTSNHKYLQKLFTKLVSLTNRTIILFVRCNIIVDSKAKF